MNPEAVKIILISAACIAVSIALAVWLLSHYRLVKLKAEVQEDLANTYEPEILGAMRVEKKEVSTDGEGDDAVSPDSSSTDGGAEQVQS